MNTLEIPLTQGRVAVIDVEDADLIAPYKWHAVRHRRTFYAVRAVKLDSGDRKQRYMHSVITEFATTDHINGDGLDNRRDNLRSASQSQNLGNRRKTTPGSSQFKGVSWSRPRSKWQVQIQQDGRRPRLGRHYFDDEVVAALAYDAAARRLFGEFAALNFPRPGEQGALVKGGRPS